MRAVAAQTIEVPPLCFRADITSIDREQRTVELIFSTGAGVERYDWNSGKRYIEKLALTPSAVRLDRLNAGGPLLDAHSAWSITDQIGGVVPGTAKVRGGKGYATVKFSRRDSVEGIWQDVLDGIVRSVSAGYRTYKYEEDQPAGNALPVRTATDWEPFEISMVPMPADIGAKVRSGDKREDLNTCALVMRGAIAAADADRNRFLRLMKARTPFATART